MPHDLLLSTISEKFHDGRFVKLIKNLLEAGYLEDWRYNQTISGVPQGSVLSPILSNILLDKLDTFVTEILTPQYTRGKERKRNPEYQRFQHKIKVLRKQGQKEAAKKVRKQLQKLPSMDTHDPDFRRLKYVRYADDFVLAFTGPRSEAEEIKRQLTAFLREELLLALSDEKTLITHARNEAARFLGYEVTTLHSDTKQTRTKQGRKRRSINGHAGLRIPRPVIMEKCARYTKRGKPTHRTELLKESDFSIIETYQNEYRGIVEYYRLAFNLHTLNRLKWIMEISLTKTLAYKHKTSVRKIYKKYQRDVIVEGKAYKVLQTTVPREGKEPLVATWGGIPLTWNIEATITDRLLARRVGRSELEKRLLAQVCELCEATRLTAKIEVHHIRALKDLKQYDGREKPRWVQMMATRRRKTLVLCHECHVDLHAGRPLKPLISRSRTE